MIEIVTGSLLDATEKYICHQTNCLSRGPAGGIAAAIFAKYPYADTYVTRTKDDEPGTIDIRGGGQDRLVINMNAQIWPGGPRFAESTKDGTKARQKYFYQCLLAIARKSNLESIAFPYKIGCGLGGGDWTHYLGTLNNFAEHVGKIGVRVTIYQRQEDR
jgi:O-acetyl-ADP-ribose deacetylase (regulator of RNase III)